MRNKILFGLLLALVIPSAQAWAQGPPLEPPPAKVTPPQPWQAHPAAFQRPVEGTSPIVVDLGDVSRGLAMEPGERRTHVQGEYLQYRPKGIDLVNEWEKLVPDLPDPEVPEDADPGYAFQTKTISLNVDGIADSGWFPPDTIMAVGANHILEAVNSGFAVYNKSGTQVVGYTSFQNFFSGLQPNPWNGMHFDPRVVYVASKAKYLMLILGVDNTNQNSYVFLAVSQADDPTGTWWQYRFTADTGTHTDAWLDFAGLGGDDWGVYFTGNYFYWAGGFKTAMIWTVSPAVWTGGAASGVISSNLTWPGGALAFALQPAIPHSVAGDQATFFVNTYSGSGNQVLLWKVTGNRATAPVLTRNTITITRQYNALGNNVDQPGTASDIDAGDCRVGNVIYSQRRVFTVLTTDVENNGNAAGVIALKLHVDNLTEDWENLTWGGANYYFFYPAVTIAGGLSATPHIAWFGSWTHATTQFPSTLYKLYDNDASHTAIELMSTRAGNTWYAEWDGVGRNRWGDYSGAGYDWQSGELCGAAEYAVTNTTWGTRIYCAEDGGGGGWTQMVDDSDSSNVYFGGPPEWWWEVWGYGQNNQMHYTWNVGTPGEATNFIYWYFDVPENGNYLVEVFIPSNHATTTNARYYVHDGTQWNGPYIINQNIHYDAWVTVVPSIYLQAGTRILYTGDYTGEPTGTRKLGVDAARMTKL